MYNTAYQGIRDHYEIMNEELAPLPQCALNKSSTHTWEKEILDVYKSEKNSLFSVIADSLHWTLMHDGISKFNTEFNGVYIRGSLS